MSLADTNEPNPYELLGLESEASESAIKTAYRKRSLAVHPDRNPDNAEAAHKFHELNNAYNLLLDPVKKAALDEAFRAQRARKERFKQFDAKRRNLQDDLEARERAFKRQRVEKFEEERKREQNIERVKEEGRRKMKEREDELARQNAAPAAPPLKATSSASASPALGPLDTTVRVKYALATHPSLSTPAALESRLSQFGELDMPVLSLKAKKVKKSVSSGAMLATAVVHFSGLESAHAAVCASNDAKRGFTDLEITWAGGVEPAVLAQLKEQWNSTSTATSSNATGSASNSSKTPVSQPASKQTSGAEADILARLRAFGSTTPSAPESTPSFSSAAASTPTLVTPAGLDFESITLLRMREMERDKLESDIREQEAMDA
ncbi:DnaJ-domain-containing protein [Auriculariales sp. MPI-PUGE-AT-0066]|nr:DnaJ-domain-containing protein [Auriculariales sp. MPI-PUGE-AT-0066]